MQIVISIPEEAYNTGQLVHYFGVYSDKLDKVIYDGRPLPKNNGRLIDEDALNFNANYNEPLIHKQDIDNAPTIIEGSEAE